MSTVSADIVAQAAQSAEDKESSVKYWTDEEDKKLSKAVTAQDCKNWKLIAENAFPDKSRSDIQCLHRWKKVLRPGLKKGPWTPLEDDIVLNEVIRVGIAHIKWSHVASKVPGRLGKQVRERWYNHLDPNLNKEPWSDKEDADLVKWQSEFGNKWVKIAEQMHGRSENGIKNRWNSAKRRRGGVDKRKGNSGKSKGNTTTTHKSRNYIHGALSSSSSSSSSSSNKRKASSSSGSSSSSSAAKPVNKKTKVDI